MNNGEYIRENYMQDNKNMAEYFMCLGCEYSDNCLESVDGMINKNENCKERYIEWLEFLNKDRR